MVGRTEVVFRVRVLQARYSGGVTPDSVIECLLLDPTLRGPPVSQPRLLSTLSRGSTARPSLETQAVALQVAGMFMDTAAAEVAEHPREFENECRTMLRQLEQAMRESYFHPSKVPSNVIGDEGRAMPQQHSEARDRPHDPLPVYGADRRDLMEVRLRPMDGNGQRCLEFDLDVSSGIKPRTYRDGYGNHVHYFNLVRPHTRLHRDRRSLVETGLEPDKEAGEELVHDFLRYRSPVKDVQGVRELAARHPIADRLSASEVERALEELTLTISREFTYDRAVTDVYSAVDEVLELRAGVCQDFAHLFIAAARAMGVPRDM